MKKVLFTLLLLPSFLNAQYCVPTHGKPAVMPIIDRVQVGTIDNSSSGFALTNTGYSDFIEQTTTMEAGSSQTITIETDDFFPHNIGVWIDYNRDYEFSENEMIASFEIGGSDPMIQEFEFSVPDDALNGTTRMRVRGMLEPFGPWSLSMDPCLPASGEGEIEDYSVQITNGIEASVKLDQITWPKSMVGLGEEEVSVTIQNMGNEMVTGAQIFCRLDGVEVLNETLEESINPGETMEFTFSEAYDFTDISCEVLEIEIDWSPDENTEDNIVFSDVCQLQSHVGSNVWYIHSDINGGIEPLGGSPFFSTTNVVTMNSVFGESGWEQEYFETADVNEVFSEESCVIFLDGSFDHSEPLEVFLENNRLLIENWVASGGNLFINYSKEYGEHFYTNVGFEDTFITIYTVSYAEANSDHEILDGPFQPLANSYTGFYFSNAVVVGKNMETVMYETNENGVFGAPTLHLPVLGQKIWGEGQVLIGGLSPSQLVQPAVEAMNMRANVLNYLNGCAETSSITGLSESNKITVYPNPSATGLINIVLPTRAEILEMEIMNLGGSIVKRMDNLSMKNGLTTIDVGDLESGAYLIRVKTSQGEFVERVMVVN